MEKQKTAVEWYNSKIKTIEFWVETKQITWKEYHKEKDKIITQAKQMEKEQIIDAFDKGLITENVYHGYDDKKAEHYYESKYGKDEI